MEWLSHSFLTTITGVDIALWILAYGACRVLTSRRWEQQSTARVTRRPTVIRRPVPVTVPTDRWERRAAMLEKMGRSAGRRQDYKRRLGRAA